ncbi:MAG: rRNA pseudouridine synthase [Opitutaceae bacterium]|nr:rRNA pseudouridine synthase [Verrucomicrobiales bacterium]
MFHNFRRKIDTQKGKRNPVRSAQRFEISFGKRTNPCPIPGVKPRRLDQILANYGYCSRSEAKRWIRGRRVVVGGQPAQAPEDKADPATVLVDGEPVEFPEGILAIFHKPSGYVCTHEQREGPTVFDLLPPRWIKRNPPVTSVGRLDKDTTGLLIVTDSGQLVQKWTSPKHKVPKVYEVTVEGVIDPKLIELFASGRLLLDDEDKPCLPARLQIVSSHEARLELVEGRFHQVKRMFESQGLKVVKLHRSRVGEFDLAGIEPGKWKMLKVAEYAAVPE